MKEEDLHWIYIFHYWLGQSKPKFENKEDEEKYLQSDEYVFKNQLVFSIIEYCKIKGLKPFEEESSEIFNKFNLIIDLSIDGIKGYGSNHNIRRNFVLREYLDEAEKSSHSYDYDSLQNALISYLESPIRNTYLDRFYLFHLIDIEVKEFYSGTNHTTSFGLSYNQLRTGLIGNKKIRNPSDNYAQTYALFGLILFVIPFLINILNNQFFNLNLLSTFYEYFYENLQIIFITYVTIFIISIYNYISDKDTYKKIELYQTQISKIDRSIVLLIMNILDQDNFVSVRELKKDIQKTQDNENSIYNITFPHLLHVLLEDIEKRGITTLPQYGIQCFQEQYYEDVKYIEFNAQNFYRSNDKAMTTLFPSYYLTLFVILEYFRNQEIKEIKKSESVFKETKIIKLSTKKFIVLLRKKIFKLEASSFFYNNDYDKELKFLQRKEIISIKEDYIYERNFPKTLFQTDIYLIK